MEKVFIPGTENKYEITTEGTIISYRRYPNGRVLKPHVQENGYLTTTIKQDGVFKIYYIHRLVAATFIPNPDNLPQVNHKNFDKTDNRVENLEWCTAEYNCTYNFINDYQVRPVKTKKYTGIPTRVAKLDRQGNLLRAYYSIKEAARDIAGEKWNSAAVQINKIISGAKGHHTCCGYGWKKISDEEYINLIKEHEEWLPENVSSMRLPNYRVITYLDKTVHKYNPKTGEFTKISYREKYHGPASQSCPLFD